MKPQTVRCLIAVALAALPSALQAQADAHYVPGVEGIKCATLPPPGFYFRDYNVFYYADQINNGAGKSTGGDPQAVVYANVPRVIWITDKKLLGGYYGGDVVVPVEFQSVKNIPTPGGPFKSSTFGLADMYAENTLSWHPGQFDIGSAVGLWLPTGASAAPPSTRVGQGFWTPELTLGVTWYTDEAKTWAISALNRYEFNSEDRDTHITPGQAWTLEWGVSKAVTKTIDCGLVGYYQQRVTASKGDYPMGGGAVMLAQQEFPYSRVAGVGPEVNVEFPIVTASLRYYYEFMADNRFQGHTVTLTLTKRF